MRIAQVGKRYLQSKQRPVLMLGQWSLYANYLDVSARDRYERKLEYGDSADKLPDPYFTQDGWQNYPNLWPYLTFGDIYNCIIVSSRHKECSIEHR